MTVQDGKSRPDFIQPDRPCKEILKSPNVNSFILMRFKYPVATYKVAEGWISPRTTLMHIYRRCGDSIVKSASAIMIVQLAGGTAVWQRNNFLKKFQHYIAVEEFLLLWPAKSSFLAWSSAFSLKTYTTGLNLT